MSLTRRLFLKALAVVSSSSALAACSKNDDGAETILNVSPIAPKPEENLSNPEYYWTSGHNNCSSGRGYCASKIHVVNGRIVRVTTDDSDFAYDGTLRNREDYNDPRALNCPKCKSLKYRTYSNARLKYALIQTKQRGDMSGFIRVTPERAMNEIIRKHRAIVGKYGAAAVQTLTATAASGTGGASSGFGDAREAILAAAGSSRGMNKNYSYHQWMYSFPITGHPAMKDWLYPDNATGYAIPHLAGCVMTAVSWGSNILTTSNPTSWAYIRAMEHLRERGGKYYFIGPELVDTGVTVADEWIQLRNYTDAAFVMGMFHHMIVETFDENGNVRSNPMLDLNYIDTFVHGFFDSPGYWVNTKNGTIVFTNPNDADYRKVDEVPAGKSLSAYVMGSDDRLTKARYDSGSAYDAAQFATRQAYRNRAVCSYQVKEKDAFTHGKDSIIAAAASSIYKYKKDVMTPKTPEWAAAICGASAESIRNLAATYCNPAMHPIYNEWSGGLQKQDNGVSSLYAIMALMCVTKTIGLDGESFYCSRGELPMAPGTAASLDMTAAMAGGSTGVTGKTAPITPAISCAGFFNAIKLAFFDELKAGGYTAKSIPNWNINSVKADRFVNDDAGIKTCIMYKRDTAGNLIEYTGDDGLKYYDWVGRETNTPHYVGARMLINPAGGMIANQHFNTNDLTDMYKALKIASINPDDPDTLCIVHCDLYMSPSARFADYVLPGTAVIEQCFANTIGSPLLSTAGAMKVFIPPLSKAAGEAKDGWSWTYEAYKAQAKLGDFSVNTPDGYQIDRKIPQDAHLRYVKTDKTTRVFEPALTYAHAKIDAERNTPGSRFHGLTREQVYERMFLPRAAVTPVFSPSSPLNRTPLRVNIDNYLNLDAATMKVTPFVFSGANTSIAAGADAYANGAANIAESQAERPNASGKLHVYNSMITWDYERRYSKYHGWLSANRRGQTNKDRENDPIVVPIPFYFAFEDSFKEAYGIFDGKSWDMSDALTLGTTHDRFRTHSSFAENPLLRELNHRTLGGGSGNDWNEFGNQPETMVTGKQDQNISAMISTAIQSKNRKTASWQEIWMNADDAAERGIAEGDLVLVQNPIGAVRVIARLTHRCIRGHINLHQGSWYDPNPMDGVDDGACANTLMSSVTSRYDNGNAQQFALVKVSKVSIF